MIETNIKCVIVDDEVLARDLIQQYLEKIPNTAIIGSFESPLEAMMLIESGKADILFLDIQMPEITGLDFLKSLEQKVFTIITSAYPEYALEGYELNVSEYLVKPIAFPRFIKAFNKIKELVYQQRKANAFENRTWVQESKSAKETHNFIAIKSDKRTYKVSLDRIVYIEGALEYVTFHLDTGEKILSLHSLKTLEQQLPEKQFIRTHRSYIVAFHKIESMEGNQLLVAHKELPIGKSYKEILKRRFSGLS